MITERTIATAKQERDDQKLPAESHLEGNGFRTPDPLQQRSEKAQLSNANMDSVVFLRFLFLSTRIYLITAR